jgi:hypothetical protein
VEARRLANDVNTQNKNEFAAAARMVTEHIKSLQEQAKDPMLDPKLKAHLNAQINKANDDLNGYFKKAYPGMKLDDIMQQPEVQGSTPAATGPAVLITLPNGQSGNIPESQVDAFIKAHPGATRPKTGPSAIDDLRNAYGVGKVDHPDLANEGTLAAGAAGLT